MRFVLIISVTLIALSISGSAGASGLGETIQKTTGGLTETVKAVTSPVTSAAPPLQEAVGAVTSTTQGVVGGVTNTVEKATSNAPAPVKEVASGAGGAPKTVESVSSTAKETVTKNVTPITSAHSVSATGTQVTPAPSTTTVISPPTSTAPKTTTTTKIGTTSHGSSGGTSSADGLSQTVTRSTVISTEKPGGKGVKTKTTKTTTTVEPVPKPARGLIHNIYTAIPKPLLFILLATLFLALMIATRSYWESRRSKRREKRLNFAINALQGALIPSVPPVVGGINASAAYVPASGPGAGGDFFDVFELEDGRVAAMIGDVAGHGPEALNRTVFVHYALRAWLRSGREPREALRLASEALDLDLDGGFVTAIAAIYDPRSSVITWATAGHPPPIFSSVDAPLITGVSAPPIGVGVPAGQRQTSLYLPPHETVCLYTDGLTEARTDYGMLEERGFQHLLRYTRPESAKQLMKTAEEHSDTKQDDSAIVLLRKGEDVENVREEKDLLMEELDIEVGESMERAALFLSEAGIEKHEASAALEQIERYSSNGERVILNVFPRLKIYAVLPESPAALLTPRVTQTHP